MLQIICKSVPGYKPNEVVEVADAKGVPLEKFWRKRLRDAEIDNCCEIIPDKKAKKAAITEGSGNDNSK